MGAKFVKLDMKSLNNGAVSDLFARGLSQVLANIGDPNTDAERTRKVTITFELKPTKTREAASSRLAMSVGLAPVKSVDGSVVLDHDGEGNVEAYTSLTKEQELPLEGGANGQQRQEAQRA